MRILFLKANPYHDARGQFARAPEGRREASYPPVTAFAALVRDRLAKGGRRGPPLDMGSTPDVLCMLGCADLPLHMPAGVLFKLATGKGGERPAMTVDQISSLPELLDNPLAVFDSATVPGTLVVMTAAKDVTGNPIIAAISPDGRSGIDLSREATLRVNVLTSAYGKDNHLRWVQTQIRTGLLRYLKGEAPEPAPAKTAPIAAGGASREPRRGRYSGRPTSASIVMHSLAALRRRFPRARTGSSSSLGARRAPPPSADIAARGLS